MKINQGIKTSLYYNILILGFITVLAFIYLFRKIVERDELIREVTENYQPSLTNLTGLLDKFEESRKLILFWSKYANENDTDYKDEFNSLFTIKIPVYRDALVGMTDQWQEEDFQLLMQTANLITDSLYFSYLDFINTLKLESTGTDLISSDIEFLMQDAGLIFLLSEIDQNLNYLIDKRNTEITGIFNEISEKTTRLKNNLIILSLFLFLFIVMFIIILNRQLNKNISILSNNLSLLGKGIIPEEMEIKEKNEFEAVTKNLNRLFEYMKNLTLISKRIGAKDFSTEFKPLGEHDELGTAIVNLQENLKTAHEEQLRYEIEENQRTWVNENIARINDILRTNTDDIEELAFELIKAIVSYTGAKVGGLFIINNENPEKVFFELISSYAYDRRKKIEKTILPGEGLVGKCLLEKETNYLTDIPNHYLSIKSGLGEDNPVSLLIVPLHLNENVYGAIELASFSEIENYKIKFVETIGENIATTISKLKNNLRTTYLLDQTRQQAEELLAQEEEMRQNMDELRATQEQSAEKEQRLTAEIKDLKKRLKEKEGDID